MTDSTTTVILDSAVKAQIEYYVDSVFFAVRDHALRTARDLDVAWIVVTGIVAFFILPGLVILQGGYSQPKNVTNVLFNSIVCLSLAGFFFWVLGYGIAFGTDADGFIGSDQFALSGIYNGVSAATSTRLSCVNLNAKEAGRNVVPGCNWRGSDGWEDWFLQFVMAASVALITVAALAERASLLGLAVFTAILSAFIYPVVVHWAWGLGWLDAWATSSLLRDSFGFNNGMIDLGGSGVIHLVGGLSALLGALLVGPRAGRFDEEGKARDIYSGNAALQSLGALLVWVGFYGITCGRTMMLSDGNANVAAKVAVNLTIAAAASCIFAILISLFVSSKFQLTMALQGLIAGLVSVSGGAHVIDPWMAFLVGAIASVVFYAGQALLLLLRIDDACDTAVVHGFCGLWGLWAVGIFCTDDNIRYAGYPVRDDACRTAKQFGIQVVASLAVVAWVCVLALGVWLLTYLTIGLRVSYEDEDDGIDLGFHGVRMTHALHTSHPVNDDDNSSGKGESGTVVSADTIYQNPSARAAEAAKLAAAATGRTQGVTYQGLPMTVAATPGAVPAHFQLSGTPVVVGRPEVYG